MATQCTWNALKHKPHLSFPLPGVSLSGCSDRITEKFRLKGSFYSHLCRKQENLQVDQVAQSPNKQNLEYFQGLGTYYLSRQPVPGFQNPYCRKKSSLYLVWKSRTSLQILEQRIWLGASGTPGYLLGGKRWAVSAPLAVKCTSTWFPESLIS